MSGLCEFCGRWGELERHHLIGGTANRRIADKYGLTMMLCQNCHKAAHRDINVYRLLHQTAQKRWMKQQNATVEEFILVFGKNYLED